MTTFPQINAGVTLNDRATETMFRPHSKLRWNGQPVLGANISLRTAINVLPTFFRQTFGSGKDVNVALDTITRDGWHEDSRKVPVAVVSRKYRLLQHRNVLRDVANAIDGANAGLSSNEPARVLMTPLGERVECRMNFRGLSFDPGDGHPVHLQLLVRNSVDGSCAFEISVRWLRQVCSNGMCVLKDEDRLREVHHRERFDLKRLRDFITTRATAAIDRQRQLKAWAQTRVDPAGQHALCGVPGADLDCRSPTESGRARGMGRGGVTVAGGVGAQ